MLRFLLGVYGKSLSLSFFDPSKDIHRLSWPHQTLTKQPLTRKISRDIRDYIGGQLEYHDGYYRAEIKEFQPISGAAEDSVEIIFGREMSLSGKLSRKHSIITNNKSLAIWDLSSYESFEINGKLGMYSSIKGKTLIFFPPEHGQSVNFGHAVPYNQQDMETRFTPCEQMCCAAHWYRGTNLV